MGARAPHGSSTWVQLGSASYAITSPSSGTAPCSLSRSLPSTERKPLMRDSPVSTVRTSIIVEVPTETAFAVFTGDIGGWWAPDHHILEAELAEMVFEPRAGGHVYDRGVDGSE